MRVHCDCPDVIGVDVQLLLQMQIVCCATNFTKNIALHTETTLLAACSLLSFRKESAACMSLCHKHPTSPYEYLCSVNEELHFTLCCVHFVKFSTYDFCWF
jgi:hypothetical protein